MTQPGDRGPWRLLILDGSREDPKWLLATVTLTSDVRPAAADGDWYADWPEVVAWVSAHLGATVTLTPASAVVWAVREVR